MANQATGITLLGSLHFKLICGHSLLLKPVAACLFVCFDFCRQEEAFEVRLSYNIS